MESRKWNDEWAEIYLQKIEKIPIRKKNQNILTTIVAEIIVEEVQTVEKLWTNPFDVKTVCEIINITGYRKRSTGLNDLHPNLIFFSFCERGMQQIW